MKKAFGSVIALAVFAGTALAGDITAVNGYRVEARYFNNFPTTNLLINGTNYPAPANGMIAGQAGPVDIDETFAGGSSGFANKHIAWLSEDGGASRFTASNGQSWIMNFDIMMSAPSGSPRKEAGIEIHNPRPLHAPPYTDEGQVMIASDGEVAVFGAVMPFHGFGPNTYTLGTTANVSFHFYAPGAAHPTLGAYRLIFNDFVTGLHDSGLKLWSATESDGTKGFNTGTMLGFKAQNQLNPFGDASHVIYSNISIVPAPAGAMLLGLAGLCAARRRR
jgi:hypothetical protein